MKAKDIMTEDCICCERETTLQKVSELMAEHDCGCIPVVENLTDKKVVGIITDRDIVCRTIAKGKDPRSEKAGDHMSESISTASAETPIKECCQIMKHDKVRRLPVVDNTGKCCGIVSQADIACNAASGEVGDLLRKLSEKVGKALRRIPKPSGHKGPGKDATANM